ncbi:MAG: DUF4375 domain-containing protein [Fibrella sp.]|nr:DUF4375 domain-containing protein [Armatimonadota bacterium]
MISTVDFINQCNTQFETGGLGSLSEDEKTVCLINLVDFEVSMGGLAGFYNNSSGDYTSEAVFALEKVGAFVVATALRDSASLFGTAELLRNREHRQDLLPTVSVTLRAYEQFYYTQIPTLSELTNSYVQRILSLRG